MNEDIFPTLWENAPNWVRALSIIAAFDLITRVALFFNVLSKEKGTDRICWLLATAVPILGPIAFAFICIPQRWERDEGSTSKAGGEMPPASPQALAWAKSILDKKN